MRYSLPLNVVRYRNGTLVKLSASAEEFISYNYDPETETGTYTPSSIEISATIAGNLTFSKWQYRKDGGAWTDISATNDLGITITATSLRIVPSSRLFDKTNTYLTFKCLATDNENGEEYYDTVGISRIVDYIILYRKQQTDIDQTVDKIALIASDEQLRQYGPTNTVVSDLAALKVTAQGISSTVSSHTTALAGKANTSDVNAALANKADTTYVAQNYSTKTQTAQEITQAVSSKVGEAEVRSLISQSADAIRLMAKALAWTSDNSSLTEAGFLTITGGKIASYTIDSSALTYVDASRSNYMQMSLDSLRLRRQIGFRTKQGIQGLTLNPYLGLMFLYDEDSSKEIDARDSDLQTAGTVGATPNGVILQSASPDAVSIHLIPGLISVIGEMHLMDDLTVGGTKSRQVETENYQDRCLYCYETPTPLFGDVGEAVIDEDGFCYVDVDDIFSETIANHVEYQVFLQKEGSGDCWVADKQRRYFVIEGTPGLKVAWELKAKQRDYEMTRLEPKDSGLDEYRFVDDQGSLFDSYVQEQEELLYG